MKLKISETLSLPIEAVTQKLAFLGTTGSGKSYAATKLAEEMHYAGAQIVAIDPVGIWYGLRSAANGKDPGLAIPVFGGLHGDVPLEATGGALIADLIVDKHLSCIIDVSQFEHDTDKARFAADFGKRLFFRKKAAPSAMHLFVEECEELLPQDPERGEERMIHEFKRIWKLGRNFGIGGSLISQRPQEILKKALNLTECLFAFQTTGPHERKAIDLWISDKGLDQDIAADLPKLARGQCHLWSPSWLKVSETIKISSKWTFDSSSTPKVGTATKQMKLAEINLAEIAEQMRATIEKSKANDPTELKRINAALQREISVIQKTKPTAEKITVEVPALSKDDRKLLADCARCLTAVESACRETINAVNKFVVDARPSQLSQLVSKLSATPGFSPVPVRTSSADKPAPISRTKAPAFDRQAAIAQNGVVGKPHRAFLTVLAHRQGKNTTRNQLAVIAGYSAKSSHVDNTISALRTTGRLSGERDDLVITQEGLSALGAYEPLPKGAALLDYWIRKAGKPGGKMLGILAGAYPNTMTRDQLGQAAEYSLDSSHVDNTISHLRTLGVISGPRAELKADDELFDQ